MNDRAGSVLDDLQQASVNEPFKPFAVIEGRRSALPIDFQPADVQLFEDFADAVDHPWLRARLADLIWLIAVPRDRKWALVAIDAYRQVPLGAESWVSGGRECWDRAISLTLMLKRGAGDRLREIESALVFAFDAARKEDGYLALWLADMLASHRLASSNSSIGVKLEEMARQIELDGDLHRARDYFDRASIWCRRSGNSAKAAELTVSRAECWVKEALALMASDRPSNMVAAAYYESAIQTYRSIPRSERTKHRVDERIDEIRKQLNDAGARSLDEMAAISTPAIDLTEAAEAARSAVTGKAPLDALVAFANLYSGAKAKKILESTEKLMRAHPLQALIGATHMSHDGRVIAKRPGMGFGGPDSEDYKRALSAEMVNHYAREVGLMLHGRILPALVALRLEHRLRLDDFVAIAGQSPIVPNGRAGLFGRALFFGYDNDFIGALHVLIPQVEHMVRSHLKAAGKSTTTIDKDGIENENGLSTLVAGPDVAQIFGEDVAFELDALFCDAFGPNLRNELAHGLMTEEACQSEYAIYAWWFALRLVVNTFWNQARAQGDGGDK